MGLAFPELEENLINKKLLQLQHSRRGGRDVRLCLLLLLLLLLLHLQVLLRDLLSNELHDVANARGSGFLRHTNELAVALADLSRSVNGGFQVRLDADGEFFLANGQWKLIIMSFILFFRRY